ncbi:MAG TPA: hypothetical protein VKU94_06710 [Geobacterales bacterium]|nr:hypothetical protein [Geobacterales bacterium]
MKDHYVFDLSRQTNEEVIGTLATLSNGYFAVRGEHELLKSNYGTIVAGVYSYVPIFYREIVNLPRITPIELLFEGEKLTLSKSTNIRRILNVFEGTLSHRLRWKTKLGTLEYSSIRFVHKKYKNLFAMKLKIKSIDANGKLLLRSFIDTNIYNRSFREEVLIKLFRITQIEKNEGSISVSLKTNDNKYILNYVLKDEINKKCIAKEDLIEDNLGESFYIDLQSGEEIELVKYVLIGSTMENLNGMANALSFSNFFRIYEEHVEGWKREWDEIGLDIEGDEDFARGVIFNTFHLLQLYNEQSHVFMLPARGLHGFGYRGHIFWDSDIYAFPFYLFFKPEAAKAILNFRYEKLASAKENARMNGYKGAQYPWESADDGYEATPREVPLDLAGSRKVIIQTGDLEHHITADVAYAVELYYRFSRDEDFMFKQGLDIIFETSKFWASRVEYDVNRDVYIIKNVIGPDEYHVKVNNSFYTNLLAKFNLELGVKYYRWLLEKHKDASTIDNISFYDVDKWEKIKNSIYLPLNDRGVYEEFEGYDFLEDCIVPDGVIGEALLDESIKNKIGINKLIKQADVVLGMFLLREKFNKAEMEKNYAYYFPRTTHASSLSLPSYAAVAAFLGKVNEAYKMLRTVANADLENVYGNTQEGFHIASAGGLWMALLFGLLKINVDDKGEVRMDPQLPQEIKRMKLNLKIGGKNYGIDIRNDSFTVTEIDK